MSSQIVTFLLRLSAVSLRDLVLKREFRSHEKVKMVFGQVHKGHTPEVFCLVFMCFRMPRVKLLAQFINSSGTLPGTTSDCLISQTKLFMILLYCLEIISKTAKLYGGSGFRIISDINASSVYISSYDFLFVQ